MVTKTKTARNTAAFVDLPEGRNPRPRQLGTVYMNKCRSQIINYFYLWR